MDTKITVPEDAKGKGFSKISELIDLLIQSGRLMTVVPLLIAGVFNIAAVFCQLAFFPFFSNNTNVYFHCLLYFAPIAGATLFLSLPISEVLAAVLGLVLSLHANFMPLDYYEMGFKSPLVAVVFSCGFTLAIWYCTNKARSLREQKGWGGSSAVKREVPIVAACFIAVAVLYLIWSAAGQVLFFNSHEGFFGSLPSILAAASYWAGVLVSGAMWAVAAVVADILYERITAGKMHRTLHAVFQRWMLVAVAGAFIITNAVGYCSETARSIEQANESLNDQVDYLVDQVKMHVSRKDALRESENNIVLSKARSVANIIGDNTQILESQQNLERLRDDVALETITVCDETGTIVADTDGAGIGTFNFGDAQETKQYLDLVSGKSYIIEEPRYSVDVNGGYTNETRVFAGVPRVDEPGIVQISIDAQEYARALSAESLEGLLDGYAYGKDGVVMITEDDIVVTSNDPEMVGKPLGDVFMDGDRNPEAEQALLDALQSGQVEEMQDSETMGIVYLRCGQYGNHSVFVLIPSSDIFENRTASLLFNILSYLVVLGFVFIIATILLNHVAIKGFKRTNGGLARITGGDLDQRIDEHETEEFDELSSGINEMVGALKGWINEAERRNERDLATAKTIQESALPRTFPPFPEVEDFDIFASMNAAKEVGGDFYDFFLIDDHTLGFLIADVSGKGIPGALFMMAAKTEIENYLSTGMAPADAIASANKRLCANNDAGMFVTVWAATLDYATGELTYVNAGHNFPLLRHGSGGEWEWLKKKCGLFLGTFDVAKYRQETLTLEPGDELLLYTDGVNEAFNVDEEEYGNDRLEAFLAAHNDLHPKDLVESLRADVASWAEGAEQSDDITILTLEFGEAPEVAGTLTVPAMLDQFSRVTDLIHSELEKRLCPISVQNKIDIALEELFVNVCRYAYADQEEPGTCMVSYVYRANPSCIAIQLVDAGTPFDPVLREDPTKPSNIQETKIGGLGIMMTKRSVDDLSYIYENGHNVVTFTKRW